MSTSENAVLRLGSLACDTLTRVLPPPGRRWALVDYPNHSNVGDSAIWLGELAAFHRIGLGSPSYVCDLTTFSPRTLRARVGDGTVLIHGGGNLGDLWPRHQELRERVVASLPDNPIVQLPQSMWFSRKDTLERARTVFAEHPALTLLLRDRWSLTRAREVFDVPTELCPDMALCLGPLVRHQLPAVNVRWLLRTDHEAAPRERVGGTPGANACDWLAEERRGTSRLGRGLAGLARTGGPWGALAHRVLARIWRASAQQRLERGVSLLAEGRVVVTDRLHGHVLSFLMGIPHVVLPDRHRKIESFLETWSLSSGSVRIARSPGEALEIARELVDAQGAPEPRPSCA